MGVAADQLVADAFGNCIEIKTLLFTSNPGMQHHLEQQIPQLFLEMPVVAMPDRIRHLMGFLQHVGHQRLVGLLQIPGTAPLGIPQPGYDGFQAPQWIWMLGCGCRGVGHGSDAGEDCRHPLITAAGRVPGRLGCGAVGLAASGAIPLAKGRHPAAGAARRFPPGRALPPPHLVGVASPAPAVDA